MTPRDLLASNPEEYWRQKRTQIKKQNASAFIYFMAKAAGYEVPATLTEFQRESVG